MDIGACGLAAPAFSVIRAMPSGVRGPRSVTSVLSKGEVSVEDHRPTDLINEQPPYLRLPSAASTIFLSGVNLRRRMGCTPPTIPEGSMFS